MRNKLFSAVLISAMTMGLLAGCGSDDGSDQYRLQRVTKLHRQRLHRHQAVVRQRSVFISEVTTQI